MRRCPRNSAALAAAAFASCTSFARAEGAANAPLRGTELHWVRGTGAEQCISAAELQTKVAARLGHDPFSAPAGQWLEGFVEHQGQRWSARVFERNAKGDLLGSRLLHNEAEGCRELDQALVLTIALLIAPDAAGAAAPPEVPPPVSPPAETLSEAPNAPSPVDGVAAPPWQAPPQPPRPRPRPKPRRHHLFAERAPVAPCKASSTEAAARPIALLLSGILGKELLPGAVFGLELSSDAPLVSLLRWRVAASYFKEQRANDDPRFGFGLTALSAMACVESPASSGLVAAACPGAMIGSLHAVVYQLEPLEPGDRLWSAARLDLLVGAHALSRLRTELGLELVMPLTRWSFETRDQDTTSQVFAQPWLVPAARFAVGYSFD